MMETRMNPYPEVKPRDKQLCLIYNGVSVQPAEYRAPESQFYRYADPSPQDRIILFFYSGVVGWWPFPEIVKQTQFTAEQERPTQRDVDVSVDDFVEKWNVDPLLGTYWPAKRIDKEKDPQ